MMPILADSSIKEWVISIAAPFVAFILGLLSFRRDSKTDKATLETTGQANLLTAYGQIVDDLREEVDRIRKQFLEDLGDLKQERDELRAKVKIYEAGVANLQDSVKPK